MSCPTDEQIASLLEGRASVAERAALGTHVASCDACRSLVGELDQTADDVANLLVARCTSEYVIDAPLGSGGMGVVYRASDLQLGRTVAVKLLNPPNDDAQRASVVEARFLREALITARLQHPSIIPVYQGGRWVTGEPFYAMKIVGGKSFKQVVSEARSANERLELLPHMIAVAEAIAYAHSEGVIHRDLKPDNVLIGQFGETVVADWGLAKDIRASATDADEQLTEWPSPPSGGQTLGGTILGTPAYMPPEQARGSAVDERADVYSLGALLYFMVAGNAPYSAEDPAGIVRGVLSGPPPSLAGRLIPADLIAIVEKAMARDPAARYRDAGELATDLKRLQAGQLVAANRYSTVALTRRWMRRHRGPLLTAAALSVVLVVMAVVGVRRIIAEKRTAQARGDSLILANARAAIPADPTAAVAWLKAYPAGAADWPEARRIALDAESLGVARHVFGRGQSFAWGDFSPDERSFAAAGLNRSIVIRQLRDGRPSATLANAGDVFRIRFAGPDRIVYFRLTDFDLHVWRISEATSRALHGHTDTIVDVAISPDGAWAASAGADGTVRLWQLTTGSSRVLNRHDGTVTAVRFTDDGRRVFSTGLDGVIRFAAVEGAESGVLVASDKRTRRLAGSARDRVIVGACNDGTIQWWDREANTSGTYRAHQAGRINDVDISRDGRFIASAGEDKTVALYDREERRLISLIGHTQPVDSVSFSSAQDVLASAARDGNVVLWRLDGSVRQVLRGETFTTLARFSPDGMTLASMSADRTTRIWNIGRERSNVMGRNSDQVWHVAFAPAGRSLATATRDGTIMVWNSDGSSHTLITHAPGIYALAYSGDGNWLVFGGNDGKIRAWRLSDDKQIIVADHCGSIWALAARPGKTEVASASADGIVRLFDLATGRVRLLQGHHGSVWDVTFANDGSTFASAGGDGSIRLWNSDGERLRVLSGHTGDVEHVAFAPDGGALASTGADHTVRFWQVRDGAASNLDAPPFPLSALGFSPDGKWLAAAGQGDFVRLWRLPGGTTHDLLGHTDQVPAISFSPDGKLVATASFDHTVRVWSLETQSPVAVLQHATCVLQCLFAPDGARLATITADHLLELWSQPFDRGVPTSPRPLKEWLAGETTADVSQTGSLRTH